MELWIRTQTKTGLFKVDSVYYAGIDKNKYIIYYKDIRLGIYKNEERALEVLDEIQNILKPKVFLNSGKITGSFDNTIYREPDKVEIQELSVVVYEMPKE